MDSVECGEVVVVGIVDDYDDDEEAEYGGDQAAQDETVLGETLFCWVLLLINGLGGGQRVHRLVEGLMGE